MPHRKVVPAGRPTLSISTRLTLLFALFATTLTGGLAVLIHRSIFSVLEAEDHAALSTTLAMLAPLASRAEGDPAELARLRDHFAAPPPNWGYRLRCGAETRAETAGLAPAADEFPAPGAEPVIRLEHRVGHRTVHLGAASAAGGCALQVAYDATHEERIFSRLRTRLAGLTLLSGLLAALAGGLIARTGLRPLAVISARARAVTAERLGEPLGALRIPAELRELAGEFDGMLARLAGAFARLDAYAGDLAHELRTPLSNLSLGAELALAERDPARQREALESLLEEARRLRTLVDRMLLIARAERPDAEAARRKFSIASLLERLAALHHAAGSERGISIRTEWEPGLELEADETLVRQAVGDLLDNALRHAREGGEIRLGARRSPDGALRVSIEDDGPGIDPDALPRIFERHYQGDGRPDGLGLGLALVRGVMKLHRGEATAENRPGGGARFTLAFPAPGFRDPRPVASRR